jgi:protein-disulfide isomerase
MSTLTEYGDFECPYCGAAYADVKQVRERLGDGLTFEFRHFPIESKHPHALQAAEAAEAGRAQGKFEEMHDLPGSTTASPARPRSW